jgi:uncharacterized protein
MRFNNQSTRTHECVRALARTPSLRAGHFHVIPLGQLVDVHTLCIYTNAWSSPWSETKRAANLRAHGLDFVDAALVFEGVTFTFEDDRFSYGEQRFVTLGLLAGIPVSVVHTESENEVRIISFRKATKREAQIYFDEIQN